jgi:hypothetical protein
MKKRKEKGGIEVRRKRITIFVRLGVLGLDRIEHHTSEVFYNQVLELVWTNFVKSQIYSNI